MSSSYSASLRLDLPTEGSYTDAWGDVVNDGITKLVDTAVAGTATVTVTSTNHVVSYANGATDEARAAVLVLSGTPGAAFNVFVPPVSKTYIIRNNVTTYTATIYCSTVVGNTTPAGTGIAIPTGKSVFIRTDGTNFTQAISGGLTSGTSLLKGDGSTGISNAASGTDYAPATSGTSILKGNGSGGFSNAASGTDYAPATSGTSILKGNGSGGFSNAAAGTDYAAATTGTASQLLGSNGSGGFSNVTVGSGLTYSAGTLASSGSASSLITTNFTVEESGGKLIFKYGATTIASMTSAGVFTTLSDISSNGTP